MIVFMNLNTSRSNSIPWSTTQTPYRPYWASNWTRASSRQQRWPTTNWPCPNSSSCTCPSAHTCTGAWTTFARCELDLHSWHSAWPILLQWRTERPMRWPRKCFSSLTVPCPPVQQSNRTVWPQRIKLRRKSHKLLWRRLRPARLDPCHCDRTDHRSHNRPNRQKVVKWPKFRQWSSELLRWWTWRCGGPCFRRGHGIWRGLLVGLLMRLPFSFCFVVVEFFLLISFFFLFLLLFFHPRCGWMVVGCFFWEDSTGDVKLQRLPGNFIWAFGVAVKRTWIGWKRTTAATARVIRWMASGLFWSSGLRFHPVGKESPMHQCNCIL